MKKLLGISLFALSLGVFGAAMAQQAGQGQHVTTPTGKEQIEVVGAGPQHEWVSMAQAWNGSGHLLVPTGTTVASTPDYTIGSLIATGAITTWNVSLPNPAFDGEKIAVANGTGAAFTTNTTVAVKTGTQSQTLAQTYSSQTINAGSSVEFQFDLASLTWYRIR